MNFKKERNRDYYLKDTHVENVFINEYMPPAPGDYVKVYLFALMYADLDLIMTNEDVARHLNMAVEDVLKAWTYWESMGVVKKYYADPDDKLHYEVAFQDMKSAIYGKNSRKGAAAKKDDKAGILKNMLTDEELRALYGETEHIVARPLSGGELQEILGWMTEYGATAEVILFAWRCAVKKGKQDSVKYVGSMVKDWSARGFRTASAVTAHLEDTDNRFYLYRRVLKALGMTRNATEEEKRIMDNWSDAMKLSLETILEACKKTSGISNPNINYVNSVLKAWSDGDKNQRRASSSSDDGKGWQIADVFRYYEKIRAKNEREANERREKVYRQVPEVRRIDGRIQKHSMDISGAMLSGAFNVGERVGAIRKKMEQLQSERAYLMTENNFKIDYMDIVYICPVCKDTGTQDNGEQCSCFSLRLDEMQKNVEGVRKI